MKKKLNKKGERERMITAAEVRGIIMDDLISRAAALEEIGEQPLSWSDGEYELGLQDQWASDVDAINRVPSAQHEVKVGRWIKVPGYATPGGDPVWCCSECGKGVHVYGIEHGTYGRDVADGQWVACPNCGARMEETK